MSIDHKVQLRQVVCRATHSRCVICSEVPKYNYNSVLLWVMTLVTNFQKKNDEEL